MTLTDNSPMPYGPFQGIAMANVPADYLLHLHYQGCNHEGVKQYIENNLDVLNQEIKALTREDLSDRYRDI